MCHCAAITASWCRNDAVLSSSASNKVISYSLITSSTTPSNHNIMKWLSVLPLLNYLSPLLAFQPSVVSPVRTQMAKIVAMNFFPDNFARAEYCATHSGACSLEELEELAEGRLAHMTRSIISSLIVDDLIQLHLPSAT